MAKTHYRPAFELLEARDLPASRLTATLFSDGLLRIEGTEGNDTILVRQDAGRIAVSGANINRNGASIANVAATSVNRIVVQALGGDDIVRLDQGSQAIRIPTKLYGGTGRDDLVGGAGKDTLVGDAEIGGFGGTDHYRTGTADFNGDGRADLWQVSRTKGGAAYSAYVWISNGSEFQQWRPWGNGFGHTDAFQTGTADFNGDSRADLWQVSRASGGSAYVWLSTGSGFQPWRTWGSGFGGADAYETATADFDGDGKADFWQVSRNPNTGGAYVWLSTGSNLKSWQAWAFGFGGTNDYTTATADFNGDGRADLWQVGNGGSASVWLSTGSGFQPWQSWGGGFGGSNDYTTATADFNGDGRDDFWQVARTHNTGGGYVWLSAGDSLEHWSAWAIGFGGTSDYTTATADFNGDGRADLWQLGTNGPTYVWQSTGSGFLPWTVWGQDFSGPAESTTAAADFNGDGRSDLWQLSKDGSADTVDVRFSTGKSFTSNNDTLRGGIGDDSLYGHTGGDRLDGGDGSDWLEAGTGNESTNEVAVNGWNALRWTDGIHWNDIEQGSAGTCAILAALSAAAHRGIDLSSRVQYMGHFTYQVTLFNLSGVAQSIQVTFNGASVFGDPAPRFEQEYWTVLYQRAYLLMKGINPFDASAVDAFNGDSVDRTLLMVTGCSTNAYLPASISPETVRNMLAAGNVITAGTVVNPSSPLVVGRHAYAVQQVFQGANGQWNVQLYNPWRIDGGAIQGANDGIITLSWATFCANYSTLGRANYVRRFYT